MTQGRPDPASDPALQAPEPVDEAKALELEGARPLDEQMAYIDQTDTDQLGRLTHVDMYEGELEAGVHDDLPGEPKSENLELLTELELREGETDNPDVAAEEGLTYVPPTDPPVIPGDDQGSLVVAAGLGSTALDEPYDEDHHSDLLTDEDEMAARVREALRADSLTSDYADRIAIATRGDRVVLRGVVDDIDDTDNLVAVAQRVSGVTEVIDALSVEGLDDSLDER